MKNSNVLLIIFMLILGGIFYVGDWIFYRELITPAFIVLSACLICDTLEKKKA